MQISILDGKQTGESPLSSEVGTSESDSRANSVDVELSGTTYGNKSVPFLFFSIFVYRVCGGGCRPTELTIYLS